MLRDLLRSLLALAALTVLCGLAYPVAVWGVARVADPRAAEGSLVRRDGVVIGSSLLGQPFTSDRYFRGRPSAVDSATHPAGRDGAPVSGGSNLGPNSADLADAVAARRTEAAAREGVDPSRVPVDLVTASASGLDPDISLDAALIQVPRVARARGLDPAAVEALVRRHVDDPVLGVLGERHVRVLALNLALDALGR